MPFRIFILLIFVQSSSSSSSELYHFNTQRCCESSLMNMMIIMNFIDTHNDLCASKMMTLSHSFDSLFMNVECYTKLITIFDCERCGI